MILWRKIRTAAVLAGVLFLVGCASLIGAERYSDDPAAARIQALTDFCIGYGALRDAATNFILVDEARADPVLTEGLVLGYREARTFIRPFCNPTFDAQNEPFNLNMLERELLKIRILMVKQENTV